MLGHLLTCFDIRFDIRHDRHGVTLSVLPDFFLQVDQQGQMSDAAALKILNRLNTEMEAPMSLTKI
jgi:hypothetical protein